MTHLYSTTEAAAILKLPEHKLRYAYRANHVEKPKTVIAGRQLYTHEDLRRLAEHFAVKLEDAKSDMEQ